MTQIVLAAILLTWMGNTDLWAAGPLVASGGFVRNPPGTVPAELRILTYNLHGPPNDRMDDLAEALMNDQVLKEATILGLQEVNRHHRQTGYRDVASELANTLGLYYAFAVENPYKKGGGERGLAILSRFPMSQVERIALPHAGPGGRRRIALGTTLHLGEDRLRVYSIHLETRIANRKHADQLTTVLTDANRYRELPTVILGDFNTVYFRTEQTFALLKAADFQTRPYEGPSFRRVLYSEKSSTGSGDAISRSLNQAFKNKSRLLITDRCGHSFVGARSRTDLACRFAGLSLLGLHLSEPDVRRSPQPSIALYRCRPTRRLLTDIRFVNVAILPGAPSRLEIHSPKRARSATSDVPSKGIDLNRHGCSGTPVPECMGCTLPVL